MKKRILSILLCLCMVMALLPATALAADSYTVTYNVDGATGGTPTTPVSKEEGTPFSLPTGLTKDNYTFIGWTDGTNSYLPGAAYTMPGENVTFTALWTAENPKAETDVKIADQPLNNTNAYYHNGTSGNLSGTAGSNAAGASAYFQDGVLVLNGLNVNNGKIEWAGVAGAAAEKDDLVIVLLSGSVNTVTNTAGSAIVGDKGLEYGPCLTIRTSGNTPATLYAIGGKSGLWVWQDTTIEGHAKVIAQGDTKFGIATNANNSNGAVTIKDYADVKAVGALYGISGDTDNHKTLKAININGGKLLAQGSLKALEKAANTTIIPTSGAWDGQTYWVGTTGTTRATKPTTTFTATDASSGTLSGVTNKMQYKLGDSDWKQITDGMISDGKITLTDLPASGATISVQNTNGTTDNTDDDSDVQVLTATMAVSSYNVTYNGNGATSGSAPAGASVTSGASYTVAGNTGSLEKTGYTFSGWNTEANGSGTSYAADDTLNITAETILYAQWTPAALTGTVTITGRENVVYGQTLTASVSGGNNTGTLTYKWYRSGEIDSIATGTSYQVQTADIGKTLTCKVKSNVQTGEISESTAAVTKANQPTAPAAPSEASKTSSSVTLTAITTTGQGDVEYAKNDTNTEPSTDWQSGTEFTGLSADTTYYFFARYAGDENYNPAVSGSTEIKTDPAPTYGISLSAGSNPLTSHTFTEATVGYAPAPGALTVTVTNAGTNATGDLTVELSGTDADSFTLSNLNEGKINSIAVGGPSATFYVQPKTGLSAKDTPYTATVTVSGGHSISASFPVSFTVNALGALETVTFGYAYDAQRSPTYPTQGDTVDMTTLRKPVDANGVTDTLDNAGEWKLSKVGTYSYVKTNVPASNYLSDIVSGMAQAYSISDPNTIVIHELKKGDTHIAYGVVAAYDTAGGYALFLGDTWSGGACYLLSMNVIGGTTASITAGSILTDYIPAANTYGISLSQTETHAFTAATVGYAAAPAALTVTVTNIGSAATDGLTIGLTGTGAAAFVVSPTTISDIAAGSTGTFTVQPNTGLSAGTYTATVTVSGTNIIAKSFTVSFTVNPVYTGGGSSTPPTYKVESEVTENTDGSVSLSKSSAKKDDTVTITVTPDRYYKVDGVTVKDKNGKEIAVTDNGDGTFTFKMPSSKVTVEPVFSWDNPFVDVAETAYYAPAVEWALKNDVTNGTGDGTTFSPDDGCTRAQIVTFLWRAAGCPEPAGISSFTDVSADAYYAKAVAWAVEQGITNGTGDGTTFSPDATCTRSQGVTFLYRSAGSPEVSDDIAFNDVTTGSYYSDAVVWATQNGVTDGTGNSKFSPAKDCTRAQIVTFLYRWMVK